MELDFSKKINDSSELKGLLAAEQHKAEINVLPDSEFAYIEAGGQVDAFNRTVPLTLRHFPISDEANISKSIASLIDSKISQNLKVEIFEKIHSKAEKLGVDISESAMPPWLKDKDEKSDDKKSDDKKSDDKKSDDKKSDDKKSDDKKSDDKKSDKKDESKAELEKTDKKEDKKEDKKDEKEDEKNLKKDEAKKSLKKTSAPAGCPECY